MKKLTHRRQGVELLHRLVAVDRLVAKLFDDFRFIEDCLADGLTEGGFVDEGAQVVLIGELQCAVILVEPCYGKLQRPP